MAGETIRDVIIKVAIQAGDSSSFKSVAEEVQRDLQSKIGGIDVKPFGEHAVEEMRAITTAAKEAASAIASVHGHPGIGMPGYGASVTNRASSIISQNISQMKSESGGAGLDDQHWAKLEARMQKQAESFIREQDRESAAAERAYDKEAADAINSYSKIMKERQKAADDAEKEAERQAKAAERAYDAEAAAAIRSYSKIMKEREKASIEAAKFAEQQAIDTEKSVERQLAAQGRLVNPSDRYKSENQDSPISPNNTSRGSMDSQSAIGLLKGIGQIVATNGGGSSHSAIQMLGAVHGGANIAQSLSHAGAGGPMAIGAAALGIVVKLKDALDEVKRSLTEAQHVWEQGYLNAIAEFESRKNSIIGGQWERFGDMTKGIEASSARGIEREDASKELFRDKYVPWKENQSSGIRRTEESLNVSYRAIELASKRNQERSDLNAREKTLRSQLNSNAEATKAYKQAPASIRAHRENERKHLRRQREEIIKNPTMWGNHSKEQVNQIAGIDIAISKSELTEKQELKQNAEDILRTEQKRLEINAELVNVLNNQNKSSRERVQETFKELQVQKKKDDDHNLSVGSADVGDMWERKRLQEKHNRIKAQMEKNKAEGKGEMEGVEQYTQHEIQVARASGDEAGETAEAQARNQGKQWGVNRRDKGDTKTAQESFDDAKTDFANDLKNGNEQIEKQQAELHKAGEEMAKAVSEAFKAEELVNAFKQALELVKADQMRMIMNMNAGL